MANPFSRSPTFHKLGHVTNTVAFRVLPAPRGIAVVTTTGRKTGKSRPRAMRAVHEAGKVYAVALLGPRTAWIANIRANAAVRVKLGARSYDATAREVVDADEREQARRAYHPVAGWYDYFDYANFAWDIPTRSRVLAAHDRWFDEGTLVAFDLVREA